MYYLMTLLVVVADQSQSLTWVMASLSTVLFPCCVAVVTDGQRTSMPVKRFCRESKNLWPFCLCGWLLLKHTHTHTLIMTGNTVKKPVDFHVFVDFFPPRPPTSFFSVNLRILHFSLKKKKSSPHTPPGITFKFLLLQFNFGLKPCVTSPKVQTDSLKPPTSKLDSLLWLHSQLCGFPRSAQKTQWCSDLCAAPLSNCLSSEPTWKFVFVAKIHVLSGSAVLTAPV